METSDNPHGHLNAAARYSIDSEATQKHRRGKQSNYINCNGHCKGTVILVNHDLRVNHKTAGLCMAGVLRVWSRKQFLGCTSQYARPWPRKLHPLIVLMTEIWKVKDTCLLPVCGDGCFEQSRPEKMGFFHPCFLMVVLKNWLDI